MIYTLSIRHPKRHTKTESINVENDGEACKAAREKAQSLSWGTSVVVLMTESTHTYTAKNQNGIIKGTFLQPRG